MKTVTKANAKSATSAAEKILDRHLNSFLQNDLEGVVSDYTDESVLVTHASTYRGQGEIKGFFEDLITRFPKDKSNFILDKLEVNDDLAYITWHANTPTLDVPFATDTFIFKDGKIASQTFGGILKEINKLGN